MVRPRRNEKEERKKNLLRVIRAQLFHIVHTAYSFLSNREAEASDGEVRRCRRHHRNDTSANNPSLKWEFERIGSARSHADRSFVACSRLDSRPDISYGGRKDERGIIINQETSHIYQPISHPIRFSTLRWLFPARPLDQRKSVTDSSTLSTLA